MYHRRICVRGIIIKDGKLFAQKLKHGEGERDYWCTPGGGLDDGEDLLAGLRREMIEETGVAPKIGRLLYVQQFMDGTQEQLEFFFHIENADDYEKIDLAATTHGAIEVSQYGFIDPKKEHILPEDMSAMDFAGMVAAGAPVRVANYL
ncbi:NUDIX domain-containing protein [Candidatus Saccharibacteria bacterium]|nr:NUDIX domain-containing protein [Candidatus Saccharibacteria bacterium]